MPLKSAVPYFPDPKAGLAALADKQAFAPSNLYPRDGTEELFALECQLADLTRMKAGETLAFGSGMQAVTQAIELADLTTDESAVFANGLYSQSVNYQDLLRRRLVDVQNPSIADTGEFIDFVQGCKPRLVYAETVSNTPNAHVLDIEQLLGMPLADGWDPLIVLDPTMTTPSQRPLGKLLDATDKRVVLVESGSKNYLLNSDLLGMIHTKREDLRLELMKRRRMGTTPCVSLIQHATKTLPSKNEFDDRNREILINNKLFAETLHEDLSPDSPFLVGHPNLPNHPNYRYARQNYPGGASQCLFITDQREGQENGEALLQALWEVDPSQIELGQSFGFDETRLWYDESNPAVRVSCGAKNYARLEALAEKWAKKLNQL